VPAAEQHQIILLARQTGTIAPLIKALNAEDRVIRAEASAALTFLEPGPGFDVLGDMLVSDQMFVRWQALRMLRARAYDNPDEFNAVKDQMWPLALSASHESAPNSLTRREEALLVKDAGSADDTPWLIECLKDPDTDVQIAVAWALGQWGSLH
jgi:HEAT repeat protein